MRTIFKYQPQLDDRIEIESYKGAFFLDAQIQHDALCFWFLVDTDKPLYTYKFAVFGTGRPVDVSMQDMFHVATVQQMGGTFIWHIFRLVED